MAFLLSFCKTFKEELQYSSYYSIILSKMELFNSFTKSTLFWYQNQRHYRGKKNYRPKTLLNINGRILNKILGIKSKTTSKKIKWQNQVGFVPEMLQWFNIQKSTNIINTLIAWRKKFMVMSTRFRESVS